MNLNNEILSEIIVFMKYARYLPDKQRRETWHELVDRNKQMHLKYHPHLENEIEWAYNYVYDRKVLPSMRSLQFAGKAMDVNPVRGYNCAFMNVDDWRAFPEAMFLLLSGTGVGISVQEHHVAKLPPIRKPNKHRTRRYVIGDSIAGWADAVKQLMKSYFGMTSSTIQFDFSDIREKGAELVTSGGKAPGPAPLEECLVKVKNVLESKDDGEQLEPIDAYDIVCHLAEAVLAGGIRRSAIITLFSPNDNDMKSAKTGNWWELNPQRAVSNNSVVLDRSETTREDFVNLWEYTKASGSGEPGFMWSDDKDWGANPCLEISLPDMGLCNLVEINASYIDSQEEFENRARAASVIATLQATYTDFYYLREGWKRNAEKDALIGVSMTGIASMDIFEYDIEKAAQVVNETNIETAAKLGINPAARTTAVKPAGTTSLVLGTSSGIHAWHSPYFKRRIRVNKDEAIYTYLSIYHPELLEDEIFNPDKTAIITVPIKAPEGAQTRIESALNLLSRVQTVNKHWVAKGHHDGANKNNVSCTISIRDNEWDAVRDWMWFNRNDYTGISVLPYDGGTYKQAPFEECTEEEYNELSKRLHSIDLSNVVELHNATNLMAEAACAGGNCTVTHV